MEYTTSKRPASDLVDYVTKKNRSKVKSAPAPAPADVIVISDDDSVAEGLRLDPRSGRGQVSLQEDEAVEVADPNYVNDLEYSDSDESDFEDEESSTPNKYLELDESTAAAVLDARVVVKVSDVPDAPDMPGLNSHVLRFQGLLRAMIEFACAWAHSPAYVANKAVAYEGRAVARGFANYFRWTPCETIFASVIAIIPRPVQAIIGNPDWRLLTSSGSP
jgi:hypothetical protein